LSIEPATAVPRMRASPATKSTMPVSASSTTPADPTVVHGFDCACAAPAARMAATANSWWRNDLEEKTDMMFP
jgi:hypothetical protein